MVHLPRPKATLATGHVRKYPPPDLWVIERFSERLPLTSKQVDAFAMKQANKAERVNGWKYHVSPTHIEVYIYDPPEPGIENEWTYRLTYTPFDVYHGMQMDDHSDEVRTRRAARVIAAEGLTP